MVGAVNVALAPASAWTANAPRAVELMVGFSLSRFLTVTFEPGATDAGMAAMKFLIVIRAVVAAGGF